MIVTTGPELPGVSTEDIANYLLQLRPPLTAALLIMDDPDSDETRSLLLWFGDTDRAAIADILHEVAAAEAGKA